MNQIDQYRHSLHANTNAFDCSEPMITPAMRARAEYINRIEQMCAERTGVAPKALVAKAKEWQISKARQW